MAADEATDDELKEASGETTKKKSGALKIILIVVGVLALLGTNIGMTLYLTSNSKDAASEEGAHEEGEESTGGDGEHASGEAEKNMIYFKFDPTFVVNFQAQDALRFLQVTVEVMARDEQVIAAVEQHMPIIRNNLIVLFSSQDFTTISTRVGKERIRAQTLSEIQKVLKEQIGKPGVEEVYFTNFVMQ